MLSCIFAYHESDFVKIPKQYITMLYIQCNKLYAIQHQQQQQHRVTVKS